MNDKPDEEDCHLNQSQGVVYAYKKKENRYGKTKTTVIKGNT